MNAGFSNLDTLKKRLLAGTMQSDKRFDSVLQGIGLGMAGLVEQFCQRKFALSATTESFGADRIQFLLSRTPLISVAKIEFKQDEATGWVEQQTTFIRTIDYDNGVIYLPDQSDPGDYWSLVRFTYTGGYWWEMLEPDNQDYPSTATAGATVLPDEIISAWLMQCEDFWSKRDKLGEGLLDTPGTQAKLEDIKLLPIVKLILGNFVKFNLT